MISARELRVDLDKIAAISKWPIPTSLKKVRSFIGATQYLRKFITNFSAAATPLHAMTNEGKSFNYDKPQQQAFDDLKSNINNASTLAMPNLQQPFELETYVSGYALREMLMQGGR